MSNTGELKSEHCLDWSVHYIKSFKLAPGPYFNGDHLSKRFIHVYGEIEGQIYDARIGQPLLLAQPFRWNRAVVHVRS